MADSSDVFLFIVVGVKCGTIPLDGTAVGVDASVLDQVVNEQKSVSIICSANFEK